MPLNEVFIDANFKETQLKRIRPGQPVTIKVDAYGFRKFTGVVDSISPAAGSVFTLLPPDNATGNFTKIVQRLPVRIRVPKDVAKQNLLRAGMSVYTTVDTREGAHDADNESDLDAPEMTSPASNFREVTFGVGWTPDASDVAHGRRHHRSALDDPRRRGCRTDSAEAAVCVPHHGVRDVHVDPGHPDRLGVAGRDPGGSLGQLQRSLVGADRRI